MQNGKVNINGSRGNMSGKFNIFNSFIFSSDNV
jgi:hypothetical protein